MGHYKEIMKIEAYLSAHNDPQDDKDRAAWSDTQERLLEVLHDPRNRNLRILVDGQRIEPELILTPGLRLDLASGIRELGLGADGTAKMIAYLDAVVDGANIIGTPVMLIHDLVIGA